MGKHAAPRRRAERTVSTPSRTAVPAFIEISEAPVVPAPRVTQGGKRKAVKPPRQASHTVVRATAILGGVAAAATGAVVVGGVAAGGEGVVNAAATISRPTTSATVTRTPELSRSSDRRAAADPAKAASLAAAAATDVQAVTQTVDAADGDPKAIASALLGDFGWSGDQFGCLDRLWTRESGWRVNADNPSSSAYGIPQALPGSKMASAGPNWQTNPITQIKWGLGYIQGRYGSPCGAWGHSESYGWY
ncbi:lytic transglycosylase domain-containing protein [Nocardioides sp. Kera G14]|uniref:aggregation-promoting factor C-terminal-like domain-containing protein n=1 Tax=Nocardioides sp. Kera G14 TaxID=2884264 RepID=UPI001D1081EE|nr:lytic transglycosylase domain-containing protein [Nocardioides sp. Kera G14]UDY22915.1 lytic transglycosylase domain-containing protein [Nocardioides sp. Kera G14]